MSEIRAVQKELESVKVVMLDNIEKVIQREEKLTDLENKSEDLRESAQRFDIRARKYRNQLWWQDKKTLALLIFVVLFILTLIIVPIAINAK